MRALELDDSDVTVNYHYAALKALQGAKAESLDLLRRALRIDRGKVIRWLENDRYFDSVRKLVAFKKFFEETYI